MGKKDSLEIISDEELKSDYGKIIQLEHELKVIEDKYEALGSIFGNSYGLKNIIIGELGRRSLKL